jgi:hypothetical protein
MFAAADIISAPVLASFPISRRVIAVPIVSSSFSQWSCILPQLFTFRNSQALR